MELDESDTEFVPQDWIRNGKIYKNVPSHVIAARKQLLTLPDEALRLLPDPNMAIHEFVTNYTLPLQAKGFNTYPTNAWFSTGPPTVITVKDTLETVFHRSIPAPSVINNLEQAFGQHWFDGNLSIIDPRYNHGHEHFSPWIITLWRILSKAISKQQDWKEAYSTVLSSIAASTNISAHFPTSDIFFGSRGWDSPLRYDGFEFTSHKFAQLLCHRQLCDDITQTMTHLLWNRLEQSKTTYPYDIIGPSRLHLAFRAAAQGIQKGKNSVPTTLRAIEDMVQKEGKRRLWFAVLHRSHEVAVCIDFTASRIQIGDTLNGFLPPTSIIADAQTWLEFSFGKKFVEEGNTLAHGLQDDAISCIPASMNTIAHGIFGDGLWTQSSFFLDRMIWFHALVPSTNSQETDATRVQPHLQNLLNPSEQSIFVDLIDHQDLAVPNETKLIGQDILDHTVIKNPSITVPNAGQSEITDAWRNLFNQANQHGDNSAKRTCSPDRRPTSVTHPLKKARKEVGANGHKSIGLSKSAKSERKSRTDADNGNWNQKEWLRWKKKIVEIDPNAEFDYENNPRGVRCSNCGNTCLVKYRNEVGRFREHYKQCQSKKREKKRSNVAQSRTHTLQRFNFVSTPTSRQPFHTVANRRPPSCPGLSSIQDDRIPKYLRRSAVPGGGGRSPTIIAQELFHRQFKKLSPKRKREVLNRQEMENRWRNYHQKMIIRASDCDGLSRLYNGEWLPCDMCQDLLTDDGLRRALNKPMPSDENFKYLNHRFRNQVIGEQYARVKGLKALIESADDTESPFLKFAKGAVEGKYRDFKVFLSLVEVMVQKVDRDERGVGMQNFAYSPAWDEFVHIVGMHSPRALAFLRSHFPARSRKTLRVKEGRIPSIPLTISAETFKRVGKYLAALDYTGPVALACDDTKLLSSLQLYWNPEEQAHFLVGATSGPIKVIDADAIEGIVNDSSLEKGSKMRLWTLQIPLPKMCPTVVAAIAISNTMKVPELLTLHQQIINGLLALDIRIVSYSCDGTETERSLQRLFNDKNCNTSVHFTIASPKDGVPAIPLSIGVHGSGYPISNIQDSKHALKTSRNNLFSGASLLPLGNYIAHYRQVHTLAFQENSPLYHRDVERLDRQDDNAAIRLFSAPTLNHLIGNSKSDPPIGLIVYLFVFGELIDAYQNRFITHDERLKMVLRAHYFVSMWKTFVSASPIYAHGRYFLSREFVDIIGFLVNGFISLLIIYRDHVPGVHPFLPWLHSTEPCEHLFGMARQLVKDFTMMDFINMVPKLAVKVREFLLSSGRLFSENSKTTASGYNHTYLETDDLDLLALATFPSDTAINNIAQEAVGEAESLIALLGILPASVQANDADSELDVKIPPISAWFDDNSNAEIVSDPEDYQSHRDIDDSHPSVISSLISHYQGSDVMKQLSMEQVERLDNLTNAAIAFSVEEQIKLHSLREFTDEELEECLADDLRLLDSARIPPHLTHTTVPPTYRAQHIDFNSLSLDVLAELREAHQTRHAACAVRTPSHKNTSSKGGEDPMPSESLRQSIVRSFNDALKQNQNRGITTGEGRQLRWKEPCMNGNTRNAEAVEAARVREALKKRKNVFLQAKVPHFNDGVSDAGVSQFQALSVGSFGIIYLPSGVALGKVLDICSKRGSKNSKHESVSKLANIAEASRVTVEVFEHMTGPVFQSHPSSMQRFRTRAFAHIPSHEFLLALKKPVKEANGIIIDAGESRIFNSLKKSHTNFENAMKIFNQRGKKTSDR